MVIDLVFLPRPSSSALATVRRPHCGDVTSGAGIWKEILRRGEGLIQHSLLMTRAEGFKSGIDVL